MSQWLKELEIHNSIGFAYVHLDRSRPYGFGHKAGSMGGSNRRRIHVFRAVVADLLPTDLGKQYTGMEQSPHDPDRTIQRKSREVKASQPFRIGDDTRHY
jgi:hypothetical protein